jgi:signal peptidase II
MAAKYKAFLVAFLLSVGLDQGSKIWARTWLKPRFRVEVIPGYFDFRYSENPGSAFGLFRDVPHARILLFVIGVAALFVVWSYLKKAAPDARRVAAELGLLAGGALGNIIDRVLIGRVTDFVVWKVGVHEWPTFNIADAALVVGVVALLLDPQAPGKNVPDQPDDSPPRKKKRA